MSKNESQKKLVFCTQTVNTPQNHPHFFGLTFLSWPFAAPSRATMASCWFHLYWVALKNRPGGPACCLRSCSSNQSSRCRSCFTACMAQKQLHELGHVAPASA